MLTRKRHCQPTCTFGARQRVFSEPELRLCFIPYRSLATITAHCCCRGELRADALASARCCFASAFTTAPGSGFARVLLLTADWILYDRDAAVRLPRIPPFFFFPMFEEVCHATCSVNIWYSMNGTFWANADPVYMYGTFCHGKWLQRAWLYVPTAN